MKFLFLALAGCFSACCAFEFNEALTGDTLPAKVTCHFLSDKSKGSITPTHDGVLILCESNRYGFLKIDNSAPGTNANPLRVSARVRLAAGDNVTLPELVLFWDDKNYAYIRATSDQYVYYGYMQDGIDHSDSQAEVMRDLKLPEIKFTGKEAYFRILLVDHNLAFYYSSNGAGWERIAEANLRPGRDGAPPTVLIGRGSTGAKPLLANDASNDTRTLASKLFVSRCQHHRQRHARRGGQCRCREKRKLGADAGSAFREPPGVPKTWSFLVPVGDKAATFGRHQGLAPKTTSGTAIKERVAGRKPWQDTRPWTSPEDEAGDPVVDPAGCGRFCARTAIALARTEIVWPVSGEALFWFDSNEPCRIWVNGNKLGVRRRGPRMVRWTRAHSSRIRRAIPVALKKGVNVLKLAIRQIRGDTGLSVRFERNDAPYLLALNAKMLELFPPKPCRAGARARQALLENRFDPQKPISISMARWKFTKPRALPNSRTDAESPRARAGEPLPPRRPVFSTITIASCATANASLAAFPNTRRLGQRAARPASMRAEALAGRPAAARTRIQTAVAARRSQRCTPWTCRCGNWLARSPSAVRNT